MSLEVKDATMGAKGDEVSHLFRNTTVRFAPIEDWFGYMLYGFGLRANKISKWGFEITDHEAVQFAHYGPEQHYDWHVDTFLLSNETKFDRKVTVVCLMSEPSEFEGGELQLRFRQDYTAPLVKGSVIAFPSFVEHRVTPVTSGLRATATMWLNGPKFK
jgi:PKHD-type hydroxylase